MAEAPTEEAVAPPPERRRLAVPSRVPWGVAVGVALVLFHQVLQSMVALFLSVGPDDLAGQLRSSVAGGLAVVALALLVAWAGARGTGSAAGLLGLRRTTWWGAVRGVPVAVLGVVGYVCVGRLMALAWRSLGDPGQAFPLQPLVRLIDAADSPAVLALACAMGIVVAPIAEEVVYRSMLYLPLRQRLGVLPATLLVGAVFAAMHFHLWGAPQLFVLSLIFVALFESTGTLWAPIVAHGIYNGLSILLVRLVELPA